MANILAFTEADLPILHDVLTQHPSMLATAFAVIGIERAVKYPIQDLDHLCQAFEGASEVQLGPRTITVEQARQYMNDARYPIPNRQLLVAYLLRAFENERLGVLTTIIRQQGGTVPWEAIDGERH